MKFWQPNLVYDLNYLWMRNKKAYVSIWKPFDHSFPYGIDEPLFLILIFRVEVEYHLISFDFLSNWIDTNEYLTYWSSSQDLTDTIVLRGMASVGCL